MSPVHPTVWNGGDKNGKQRGLLIIGIVQFGGRGTVISNNTIIATPGNHGMFAGIAVHPYGHSLLSGLEVGGNNRGERGG